MKFTDLDPWEQLIWKVHMCTELGEHPCDHNLTLEEVDFVLRFKEDQRIYAKERSWGTQVRHFYSYGDHLHFWDYPWS